MLFSFLYIALGVALLYFGAEWLVRGAARLARQLGISPLIIGLTVVAFGTSAPELFASLIAQVGMGAGSVAIGNVVGSNIYNLGLVLGLSAIITPIAVHSVVVKREAPICVAVTVLFVMLIWDGSVQRWEAFLFLSLFALYNVYQYREARRSRGEQAVTREYGKVIGTSARQDIWKQLAFILAGTVSLGIGAKLLVEHGIILGRGFGISDRVIGLTVVALGTSLPELATAIVAAARKHIDVLVGNVIGSNIFNILLIIGAVGAISPIEFDPALLRVDAPFLVVITGVMMFLISTGKRLRRWEGAILLVAAVGYTVYLYSV